MSLDDEIDPLTLERIADIPFERRVQIRRNPQGTKYDVHDIVLYGQYLATKLEMGQPISSIVNPRCLVSPKELRAIYRRARELGLRRHAHIALLAERTNFIYGIMSRLLIVRLFLIACAILSIAQWKTVLSFWFGPLVASAHFETALTLVSVVVIATMTRDEIEDLVWSLDGFARALRFP
jgi:uncharacterized membrane protein